MGRGDEASGVDEEDVEASMVADRIRELCGEGVDLKDIAILVRTLGAVKPFERALDRFGIPFVVSGGRTFLEAREIRDVLALSGRAGESAGRHRGGRGSAESAGRHVRRGDLSNRQGRLAR